MEPTKANSGDVLHEFFPFFKVYKDGRVERLMPMEKLKVPPSEDAEVRSKDVTISSEPVVSARVFMPCWPGPTERLPVLIYIHGGGFSIGSAFHRGHHEYVSWLVAKAHVVAVLIEYRLAPENPIPACYDDACTATQWALGHANGNGPDQWLNKHADFGRVYISGDSAGANISHNVLVRIGRTGFPAGVTIAGVAMVHPYFGGTDDDRMWLYLCPENSGLADPRLKPPPEDLARIGCEKVLVFLAERDHLRGRGLWYYEELKKSGWGGTVQIMEHEGESHVFHLLKPHCDKALDLKDKLVTFFKGT
ncbi:2-hydroxyisoflavanone dehydratase-like [Syzygium oleosum]|uniref:2-hydroxyisoflavanone dehydratase-like n=1 Tax=Syzygium oleosum TaxID=219896 RepID=UPI0024B8E2C4|nr:2-hydroxyisoflavanone dehydratase-like [Syzygium oleosum]